MTTQRQTKDNNKTTTALQQHGAAGSNNSTTSSYHTEPGVSAFDLDVIRDYYEKILGPLNIIKAADIERAIGAGLQASAICDALEQTAMAPRPSHYYFRAILVRYMQDGITTGDKAEECRIKRRHKREQDRLDREHEWYSSPGQNISDWYNW